MLLSREKVKGLPSEAKVEYYRGLGFPIGENVTIGYGTTFDTDYLDIGNDAAIGQFNDIRGERITLGNDIAFGNGSYILCPGGFRLGNCTNWGSDNEVICYNFEAGDYLQAYDNIEVGREYE
jgi:acetyltransferase-like isoleucine patch superfamily enzyme